LDRLICIFFLVLILVSGINYASAQPIPFLPPPSPESGPEQHKVVPNDRSAPKIEILTDELHDGKNVFKVRITDNSSLTTREVTYVHLGQLRTDGLFRDQNNVYKALIDIRSPSNIVTVNAADANGNVATDYKEYKITEPQNIVNQIIDRLSDAISYLQNLLGW